MIFNSKKMIAKIVFLFFIFSSIAHAGVIVDLPLNGNLTDTKGGLTAGALSRGSAATYIDTRGVLRTAAADRQQFIATAGQNDITVSPWSHSRAANSIYNGIVANTENASHYVRAIILPAGGTYVFSAEIKPGTQDWGMLRIYGSGSDNYTYFNAATGAIGNTIGSTIPKMELMPNGWYRASIVANASATATSEIQIFPTASGTVTAFAGDNSSVSLYVQNVMAEALPSGNVLGSDLFDQESLGSESITNPDFSGTWSGGTYDADPPDWTVTEFDSTNRVTEDTNGALYYATSQSVTMDTGNVLTVGNFYELTVTIYARTSGGLKISAAYWPNSGYLRYPNQDEPYYTAAGTYVQYFEAVTQNLVFTRTAYPTSLIVESISVKELQSPHKGTYGWPYSTDPAADVFDDAQSDNTGDWTENDCTLSFDTDHYEIDYSAASQYIYTAMTVNTATLYRVSWDQKDGTASGVTVFAGFSTALGSQQNTTSAATTSSWVTWTHYIYTTAAKTSFHIGALLSSGNIELRNINVYEIPISWEAYTTNTLEIDMAVGDNGALKITSGGSSAGAIMYLRDSSDLSADLVVGAGYELSFKAKVDTGDVAVFNLYDGANSHTTGSLDDTTLTDYTFYFIANSATGCYINNGSSLHSGEIAWISDITLRRVPDLAYRTPSDFINSLTIPAEPRFTAKGLLVEGSSINLLPYSEDFSEWTTSGGASVSANQTGIDGISNSAYSMIDAKIGGAAQVRYIISGLITGELYSFSCFWKQGTSLDFSMSWFDTTYRALTHFTWTSGVPVAENITGTSTVESYGNGWFRCTIYTDTNIDSTAFNRVYIYPSKAGTAPVNAGDYQIIYGAQVEKSTFPTSYIPTDGVPSVRSTEAADASDNGYSWSMSSAVTDALALRGTAVLEWQAQQDYDALDTSYRGIMSFVDSATNFLYFSNTEGQLITYDGTNVDVDVVNESTGDDMISVVRWDETLDGGAGYLHMLTKKNQTWDLNAGGEEAFDGGFTVGTKFRLSYANELPIKISRIVVYDQYLSDTDIQAEGWASRPRGPSRLGMNLNF